MLKSNIERIALILLLSLFTRTWSFSQTTYPQIVNDSLVIITAEQLKATNLVFLEHSTLKSINAQLESQLQDCKALYDNELQLEAKYNEVTNEYAKELDESRKEIEQQQQIINKTNHQLKWWRISSCSVVLILIGACLL